MYIFQWQKEDVCGEIDAGADFYDYEAKYISDCADLYIPARISEEASEQVRETAVRVYQAMGCRGLSRVDFFVTREGQEVVFNEITTGASNDIEQATKLARAMITRYGMSDEFDMVALETVNNQYLGGDTSLACSAQTQQEIDKMVVQLVKTQHEKAIGILRSNRKALDALAKYLYEKETITGEEFMEVLKKETEAEKQ